MNLQEWANLATIASSIALIGIALQVYIAHKQLKADHERSRREKSVELLMEWSRNLKKEGSVARKIIECLNEEQCREIFNQQEVKISKKHENLLRQLFKNKIKEHDDYITLSEAQSQSFAGMQFRTLILWSLH